MSGARRSFQAISKVLYVYEGAEVVRIHRACFRYEDGIHAPFFEHCKVARQVARVGSEVLVRPKLHGIDEYRGPAQVVLGAGSLYQRLVARVQVPHGGHQPKAALDFLPSGANCRDGVQNLHEKLLGGCLATCRALVLVRGAHLSPFDRLGANGFTYSRAKKAPH